MIILTFMNVVLRYIFSKGFVQSEEIARLCFIYLVYLGSIEAMRDNRHLIIDTVLARLPRTTQKALYVVLQGCIIWLMYILTLGSWKMVVQNFRDRWVATQFPTWLVYFSGAVMGVAIAILAAANIIRLLFFKISVPDLLTAHDGVDDQPMKTQEAS
jgi:TRAP-type C4-dicarboxylate transport system permease small subunit